MSFIDLITGATINRGVDRWRATDGAVLIDVRSEEEYGQGHIPGSVNIPLNDIKRVLQEYPEKETRFSSIASPGREAVKHSRF
ncbi:rhodanese-like domain-containing protein [uncultured Slackia sp.]|uniref:rhodanese-like domain-containing protein n=1 Tax=uncultured Slackia sp. TaxID=665903 RepID=UPI002590596E|nr:rhodanese-like domain-containing protein [uncultured Slackia sp.]